MKTSEIFCVCLVLTPILAVINGGIGFVGWLWIYFAYKAYMNHLHQDEVRLYEYVRDHITFKEEREYSDYCADKINRNERPKSMIEWYVEKKSREHEELIKRRAEEGNNN